MGHPFSFCQSRNHISIIFHQSGTCNAAYHGQQIRKGEEQQCLPEYPFMRPVSKRPPVTSFMRPVSKRPPVTSIMQAVNKKNRPEDPWRLVYKKRTCRLFFYKSLHYRCSGRDEPYEINPLLERGNLYGHLVVIVAYLVKAFIPGYIKYLNHRDAFNMIGNQFTPDRVGINLYSFSETVCHRIDNG